MLKSCLTISLSLLLLLVSMQNMVSYALFKINQTDIIQKWCVNKNKPQLRCNGHCYLGKKITENEQQKEPQNALNSHLEESFRLIIQQTIRLIFTVSETILASTWSSFQKVLYSQLLTFDIFHPPEID